MNELPVSMIDVLASYILTIRREVIAWRSVNMAPAHQEEHVAVAGTRGRRNDVSATPGHVPRGAIPLLPPMGL